MKFFSEFINQYGLSIIHSVMVAILSYVSLAIKKIYGKYNDERIKKDVVKMVCQAVDQMYPSMNGDDKLNEAINNTKQILCEKGINISDLELRMYIESTVRCVKNELLLKK